MNRKVMMLAILCCLMNSLQAAGNNNASQRVLGARRADTSDPNDGFKEIILMCMAFSLLAISGLNCKKNG